MSATILAPAKINLFLAITGKRGDGYHTLVTLMCPITLFDTISLDLAGAGVTVRCAHPQVPEDDRNLAFRAAQLFLMHYGKKGASPVTGVRITIDKQIPVAAGLGGGSSDAAAVLSGLNRELGAPFTDDDLRRIGLAIGADVPFFITPRPAIATGIGEQLELYKRLKPLPLVLVYPGFGISTEWVYKNLNLRLTTCHKQLKYYHFKRADFDIERQGCNDLESVTLSKYPDLLAIKKRLLDLGAIKTLMSGSGPTIFGLFSKPALARKAGRALNQHAGWQVHIADMICASQQMPISGLHTRD